MLFLKGIGSIPILGNKKLKIYMYSCNCFENFFAILSHILFILNYFFTPEMCLCDAAEHWQMGIQDPATPVMEGMIYFHNYLNFYIIAIGVAVFWLIDHVVDNFDHTKNPVAQKFTHASVLEIVWTLLPAIILVFIAIPSFALLYSLDEVIDPTITLKVIGHQWYWSYEYSDYGNGGNHVGAKAISFDSYMNATDDLNRGGFRLLETDNRVALPIKTHVRLLITAADVLHSWAVPSFGIKVDACPGRLSQASLYIKRVGVYYGQCSEICGVNHGFMPIVVRGVTHENYKRWLSWHMFGDLNHAHVFRFGTIVEVI